MLTQWSQKLIAGVVAWMVANRDRPHDERGALQSSELLGLIIITLGILTAVGAGLYVYFQGKIDVLKQ